MRHALNYITSIISDGVQKGTPHLLSKNYHHSSTEAQFGIFERLCRNLLKANHYDVIIRFMYHVFSTSKEYDLPLFEECLNKFTLYENYTLADLCQDFYKQTIISTESLFLRNNLDELSTKANTLQSINLYAENNDGSFENLNVYNMPLIAKTLPPFIFKKLLNIDINMDTISKADVDALVERTRKQAQERIESNNRYSFSEKSTEETLNRGVPGLLLPILTYAEQFNGEAGKELSFYILEEYVFPAMSQVTWSENNQDTSISGIILNKYIDYFIFLISQIFPNFIKDSLDFTYNNSILYNEICNIEPAERKIFTDDFVQFSKNHQKLGKTLCNLLECTKGSIKDHLSSENFSFLNAIAPCIMYCSGQKQDATHFLLNHYEKLDSFYRRRLFVFILLSKCILESNNLRAAYTLYGSFNHDNSIYIFEEDKIFTLLKNAINLLKDTKEYLYDSKQHVFSTKMSYAELIYTNGGVDELISSLEKKIQENSVPSQELARKLSITISAFFQHPDGVTLNLLNLPPQDNDDKLFVVWRPDIFKNGKALLDLYNNHFALFYASLSQVEVRTQIDIAIQTHLIQLQRNTIVDYLKDIHTLKDADGTDYETTVKDIEEKTSALLSLLKPNGHVRFVADQKLYSSQRDFINKFLDANVIASLMDKLPHEVQTDFHKYWASAEMVCQFLIENDSNDLDFSPAIISLTKAIELVLNCAYSKMNVHKFRGMSSEVESFFFHKSKRQELIKKDQLEFGACLLLLKDGRYISYQNGSLSYTGEERMYHFTEWNGESVFDFSLLKKFAGLPVLINGYNRNTGNPTEETLTFSNSDDEFNRLLFIKALEYVKDNFRNKVAHKDIISRTTMEMCRDILLSTEYLLWILLTIIK